jgi:hypothetical protein
VFEVRIVSNQLRAKKMDTELQIGKGGADTVESEVRAELQIRGGSADSVGSATSHDDGYRAADMERKCGWCRVCHEA